MTRRFYPAVLERSAKGVFAVWFPDFPACVAGGASQDGALEKAELALAQAVDALAEGDHPMPEPTPFERIVLPKGCRPLAYFAMGVEPPNPSERVNIYLPRNLLVRADKRAAEFGMSRSSFFGLAISAMISQSYLEMVGLGTPRSKVQTGEKLAAAIAPRKKARRVE